jgi:predicted DNA-binding protein
MRTIIDLTQEQLARLEEVAEREGISRAEAIRRAVDTAYADVDATRSGEARDAAFGIWRGRKIDALKYVDRLRDEWEERLAGLHGSRYTTPAKSYAGSESGQRAARVSEKPARKRRKK